MDAPRRERWRLIRSAPLAGAWNMAVDEAVLEAVARGEHPPTLRLYAWDPPCLSLGVAQPVADADRAALARRGWDLVRRPTGGRALLHTDELTYAVAAPAQHPLLAGGVLPAYQRLSAALLDALRQLGLPAAAQQAQDAQGPGANPVCFEVPGAFEIRAGDRKLIGSAQVRRAQGVLQHGSLPLEGDIGRVCAVLALGDDDARAQAAARLRRRAATVESVLGRRAAWEEAAQAFAAGFARALAIDWIEAPLSAAEHARAAVLAEARYGHARWTSRL
jgi:lipoyl(octanoyl) transferase